MPLAQQPTALHLNKQTRSKMGESPLQPHVKVTHCLPGPLLRISGAMYKGDPQTVAALGACSVTSLAFCQRHTCPHVQISQTVLHLPSANMKMQACCYGARGGLQVATLHTGLKCRQEAMSCGGSARANPKSAIFRTGSIEPECSQAQNDTCPELQDDAMCEIPQAPRSR